MKIQHKLLLSIFSILLFSCTDSNYITDIGSIFGTTYLVKYQYQSDCGEEIHAQLVKLDNIYSTFKDSSTISKINKNISMCAEPELIRMLRSAHHISELTNGYYDITCAPLVNAWGFGFKKREGMSQEKIDSLLQFVGYKSITIEDEKIIKNDPRIMIDLSSIAKGYACDYIADFLASKGIVNYMVEIGGEVRAKGINQKEQTWKIGINKPAYDVMGLMSEIQDIVEIDGGAVATSGNYRNFYVKDGKRYSHTINPITGYPAENNLLSVSVYYSNCMMADAYATAFMSLGGNKAVELAENIDSLEAYFIFAGENDDEHKVIKTSGFDKYIVSK
ncbi:MAG: FAD:protein FMN transferase [Bacteroidales bacterium]